MHVNTAVFLVMMVNMNESMKCHHSSCLFHDNIPEVMSVIL